MQAVQRGQRVDKNYKTMKEAKESFKGAKKDLRKNGRHRTELQK